MIQIHRFRGRSVEQAMRMAKRTLGEETLLISAGKIDSPNPDGVLYEVSVQAASSPRLASRPCVDYSTLRRNLAEIAQSLTAEGDQDDRLSALELSPVADSGLPSCVERWSEEEFHARVAASGAIALLGPTGVGKTTLCAKLLLVHGIQRGRKCGWITVDSGQVGSGKTARFLAGLLGVPCVAVEQGAPVPWPEGGNADELWVLDIPGIGALPDRRIDDYRSLLSSLRHLLTLFVVDARFGEASLDCAYAKIRSLKPAALVANMADEVESLCAVERFAARTNIPIALFGTGPSIPEDLVSASRFRSMRGGAFRSSAVPAA